RRRNRVALTFRGDATKPDLLVTIQTGDEIRFGALRTRWNYPDLRQYWVDLAKSQKRAAEKMAKNGARKSR
ncbi:MAG: hypothetical protein ACC646_11130, partial [Paracoccaceae bacterium]